MYPYLRDISPHPDPKADHFTESGLDRFASGVLLRRDMPAAMMEPLFMSNPLEAELWVQPIYDDPPTASISEGGVDFAWRRGQIAHAIHSGILSYFTPVGTIHVAAIETGYVKKGPNYTVYTKVTIVDEKDVAVASARVSLQTTLPDGSTLSDSGEKADDGTVTFDARTRQTGTYTSTVTDVSKEEWVYDESVNVETSKTLTVPYSRLALLQACA